MPLIIWTDGAVQDVEAIYEHIAEENPDAAQRVAHKLLDAGNSLELFPDRGHMVVGTNLRELVHVRYPYIIRYVVEPDDEVLILSVRHTARQTPPL